MARGGKRPGAGRPKGAVQRVTREARAKAAASGVMPLDVMLEAMRAHHGAGQLDLAAAIAKEAAPYLHPRLAAVQHTGKDGSALVVEIVRFGESEAA